MEWKVVNVSISEWNEVKSGGGGVDVGWRITMDGRDN